MPFLTGFSVTANSAVALPRHILIPAIQRKINLMEHKQPRHQHYQNNRYNNQNLSHILKIPQKGPKVLLYLRNFCLSANLLLIDNFGGYHMKKTNILFTAAVLATALFTSCLQQVNIPSTDTFPEGTYTETKETSISGVYEKYVDGEQTDKNIVSEKVIHILTVKADNKIHFTEKYVTYYDYKLEDDGKKTFTTVNPPREKIIYDADGSYEMYKGNKVIFDLEGKENEFPLQDGCVWKYTLTDTSLEIKKIMNIQIDGTMFYHFERS